MKKNLFISLLGLLTSLGSMAQQPFKKYGYEVEISTLSKGKYSEDFTTDSLVQVGSVIMNRVTGKVVSFITYDTLYSEATLDPQLISRWMSPDPLTHEYYSFSPYNFVLNNPIRYIDPDGQFPIDIHIRSFAPFKSFGLGLWHGDNRGFSNSTTEAFSRIRQVSSYETTTRSGTTTAYGGFSSSKYGAFAYSEAYVNGGATAPIEDGRINTHLYGNNDAVLPGMPPSMIPPDGGPTWDIDVHSDLSIDVADGENGNQILSIVGSVSGDQFPNAEGFVTDADGNSIFLNTFQTDSDGNKGPFFTLMGNKNQPMFNVNISIQVNQDGIFQGVLQDGNLINIEEWNSQFTGGN